MDTMKLVFTLIVLGCLVNCEEAWKERTWLANINYNNSRNWNVNRLPCPGDRVVFQNLEEVQLPESTNSLRELVLPSNFELLFPKNGIVQFSGRQHFDSCDGQDVVFNTMKPAHWTDAQNWDGWNSATPDIERIPCVSDSVRFLYGTFYKVITPEYVKIGGLEIDGVKLSSTEFHKYASSYTIHPFETELGLVPNIHIVGYTCTPTEWCSCRNEYLKKTICSKVTCSIQNCYRPVLPNGFCCPICGAYFLLSMNSPNKRELTIHLDTFLRDKGILWHASNLSDVLQVVLVEQQEYSGKIVNEAELLKTSIITKFGSKSIFKELHASGQVWHPISFGQIFKNLFLTMFAAALVFASVFAYYNNDWSLASFTSSLEGRPFVFARFENHAEEVVLASDERLATNTCPQTFDNPMYDDTRQDIVDILSDPPVYSDIDETSLGEDLTELK